MEVVYDNLTSLLNQWEELRTQMVAQRDLRRKKLSVAQKLLRKLNAARSNDNKAWKEKDQACKEHDRLFQNYADIKRRNDAIINGGQPNQDGKSVGQLKAEIRRANAAWRAYRNGEFELKRRAFQSAHEQLDRARIDHYNASNELEQIDATIDQLNKRIEATDNSINALLLQKWCDGEQTADVIRLLAERLGIAQYQDSMKIDFEVTGVCNVYFGVQDGCSHGHIVIKPNGAVVYRRMPGQVRGVSNFVSGRRRRGGGLSARSNFSSYLERCQGQRMLQFA